MRRLDGIARGLLKPINPYATILLGVFTTLWGLWLISPAWEVFTTAPVYGQLLSFAPEWAFGCWSVISGALITVSVFKGLYKWLYRALGFVVWHWGTVSILMWTGDWQNTGGLNYGFICLYCAYLYLNIKVNYKKHGEDIPNFYSN